MTLDLGAVRAAIAAAVSLATGLTVATTIPDNVTPPMAVVGPDRGTYLTFNAFGSAPDTANFVITLVTSRADPAQGQQDLDGLLLTTQVWAAFNTDPTLGGLVSYAKFVEARNVGPITWADVPYYGVDLAVEVAAK